MDFPLDKVIPQLLQQGHVFYFVDPAIPSPEPHNYVLLSTRPQIDGRLIFVHGTTNMDRVRRLRSGEPPETVVLITPRDYPDLTAETLVDCNTPFVTDCANLIRLVQKEGRIKGRSPVSRMVLNRLKTGVCASRLVEQEIKDEII